MQFRQDSAVTSLHFSRSDASPNASSASQKGDSLLLYATSASETGVFSLQPSAKRGSRYTSLDSSGCRRGCACLTDTGELVVGRREGLFRFRGLDSVGCYALEGEKQCVRQCSRPAARYSTRHSPSLSIRFSSAVMVA